MTETRPFKIIGFHWWTLTFSHPTQHLRRSQDSVGVYIDAKEMDSKCCSLESLSRSCGHIYEVTEAADAMGSRTVNRTHTHLRMELWARDEDNIS